MIIKNITNIFLRRRPNNFFRCTHKCTKTKNKVTTSTHKSAKTTQNKIPKELCTLKTIMDPRCKSVLITGGTTGIGLASALRLLSAGARKVAIVGKSSKSGHDAAQFLNNSCGKDKALFVKADLAKTDEIEEAFETANEKFNGIDIVVNAAGIMDGAHWEKEIITNVVGTIRSTLLAYQYAGKEGAGKGGIVINIAGVHALEPFPQAPTYSASMHAILGLSRSFGEPQHVKRSGLRVVSLCPGITKTKMLKNLDRKGMTDTLGKELSKAAKKAKKQSPEACGDAVVHLVKYAESGTVWCIDGSRLYIVEMPSREENSTLAAQYL